MIKTSNGIICSISPFDIWNLFNPLTLRAAETGLTILEIFHLQKYFLERISRRNVNQKPQNNCHSNILQTFP